MGTTPIKSLVTLYVNRLSKADTIEEMEQIITEAIAEPEALLNSHEDFDFLLVYTRYRKIKLGIRQYVPHALTDGI